MQEDIWHGTRLLSQSAYCNHLRDIVELAGPNDVNVTRKFTQEFDRTSEIADA
jgi:hypothetical protein